MGASFHELASVSGGGRGLGRSTALTLAKAAIDVVVTYREQEASARALASEVEQLGWRAAVLQLDTAAVSDIPHVVSELRPVLRTSWSREHIDFLVNNAGSGVTAPIAQTTEAQFDPLMRVHLKGVFFLTQARLPVIAMKTHLNLDS